MLQFVIKLEAEIFVPELFGKLIII